MVQVMGGLGFLKQVREFQSLTESFEMGQWWSGKLLYTLQCMGPPSATKNDPVQNVTVLR